MSQSSMSQLPCKSYWSNKLLELKPHSTSQGWRWLSPTGSTEIGFQKGNTMQLMLMWSGERKWKLHGSWKVVSQCEKNLKGIGSRVSDKETKNQPSSRVDNIFPRVPGLLIVSNICKYQYMTTIYSTMFLMWKKLMKNRKDMKRMGLVGGRGDNLVTSPLCCHCLLLF